MGRATQFLLTTVVAVLLSSAAIARADTTYDITTTSSYSGTVSGTITGNGDNLTGFDIASINGPNTYTFDSADAGASGTFVNSETYTATGMPIYTVTLFAPDDDYFILTVTGDFTSGLAYVGDEEFYDTPGEPEGGTNPPAATFAPLGGSPLTADDVSLTEEVAATPEPSSWLLLATGLAAMAMKRRQLS